MADIPLIRPFDWKLWPNGETQVTCHPIFTYQQCEMWKAERPWAEVIRSVAFRMAFLCVVHLRPIVTFSVNRLAALDLSRGDLDTWFDE